MLGDRQGHDRIAWQPNTSEERARSPLRKTCYVIFIRGGESWTIEWTKWSDYDTCLGVIRKKTKVMGAETRINMWTLTVSFVSL